MRRTLLLALVVLFVPSIAFSDRTFAQDATPTAESGLVLPLAPDPDTWCKVEPRPLAEVRAIWEEVNAAPSEATPLAYPGTVDKPEGIPADERTVQEITAAIVQVIACSANGNSGLHDAALITDHHLRDPNGLLGLPEEDFAAYYTENPVPLEPEQRLMVYAVHDVMLLPDGRVSVEPEVIVPGDGHYCDDYLIFANVDGRWLIDLSYYGPNCYPVG